MSEANTTTNLAFVEPMNSVNSTEADQANLSSSDSPNETVALVIVPASQAENRQFVDFPAFSSWVDTTENDLAAIAPSERLKVVALIQELRCSNSNLLNRGKQLEQTLSECQKTLQMHKERSHVAESMLTQQTEELAAVQDQVKIAFHELEASHQTAQRQQILIETLTSQLEISQERVAQLERECSLTQASYNEQSYQLVQTENTCRELRTRLTREQRQTLQFKVALEKCLQVPVHRCQSQADTEVSPIPAKSGQLGSQSLFPKARPIPPWPAQQALSEAGEEDGGRIDEDSPCPLVPLSPCPLVIFSPPAPEIAPERAPSTEDTSESEDVDWQDLISLLEALEEPVTANSPDNSPEGASVLAEYSDKTEDGQENPEPSSPTELPYVSSSFTPNANWPSPVVYPLRPPKGRKSLAAIELPTFPSISA